MLPTMIALYEEWIDILVSWRVNSLLGSFN